MSNTSSQALSVRERPATSDRRLYLAAGFGGVLAAASWAIQPLLVMQAGDDLPTLDYLLTHPWHGAIEAAVFTGMGVGVLFLVLAIGELTERRLSVVSTWARTGHALGVLAGCTWIMLAGWSAGPYTSVGRSLGEATGDSAIQGAVLHMHSVGVIGIILAASLGLAVWLVCLATVGRKAGVVGAPLAILAAAAAIPALQPFIMPFSAPWGAVLGMPAFTLLAGIAFLLKARRTL
jgi:hypothetical protein